MSANRIRTLFVLAMMAFALPLRAQTATISGRVTDAKGNGIVAARVEAKSGLRPEAGKYCPDGLAILQADEKTDARLINRIVNTAKAAGFDNLLFAVKNK